MAIEDVEIGPGTFAEQLDFDVTMAFQPIVDVGEKSVFGYEALVRGIDGADAASILAQVNPGNRYAFDQACRTKAVDLASKLGLSSLLSINFLPNALHEPRHGLQSTLAISRQANIDPDRIIFEFSETEQVSKPRLIEILTEFKRQDFRLAIDDLGSGYAGLSLLANFQPDFVKIDLEIVRGIDHSRARRAIVSSILHLCRDIESRVICEGVETATEMACLEGLGVRLMQGYFFARPGFECLPVPTFADRLASARAIQLIDAAARSSLSRQK